MNELIMIVEFEYDDESMHSGDGDKQAKDWFFNDILLGDENVLAVWDREIGDHIGTIKILEILPNEQVQL